MTFLTQIKVQVIRKKREKIAKIGAIDKTAFPIQGLYQRSDRKSSIRSQPCIILNPKFPRIVLEVHISKIIISRSNFFISTSP